MLQQSLSSKGFSSSLKKMKVIVALLLIFACCGMISTSNDLTHRALSTLRNLCDSNFGFGNWVDRPEAYWEELYSPEKLYEAGDTFYPDFDPLSIGYAITLSSCPESTDSSIDPGHSFYDAAAVLKYSICHQTFPSSSKYNATMYAFVHPDAIRCEGPTGETYDRVKVLQDLGYHVLVAGPPVYPGQIENDYLRENIDKSSCGHEDWLRLYAYKFTNHPAMVLVDFTTLMIGSVDAALDSFLANNAITAKYTTDYPAVQPANGKNQGANMGFFMLKPNNTVFNELVGIAKTSLYDPASGWEHSGVSNFPGQFCSKGLLHYYYKMIASDQFNQINRCIYNNDNSDSMLFDPTTESSTCRDPWACQNCQDTPITDIRVIQMITVCGKPWECYYDEDWDVKTKNLCEDFHRSWYGLRIQFEESWWHNGPPTDRSGMYKPEVFLGFCHAHGIVGYDRMIDDKMAPATCDPDTVSTTGESTLHFGMGHEQQQKIVLTTGEKTAQTTACLSGLVTVVGREPPYNMGIVIDVSGSTGVTFAGTPTGDVNGDGRSNKILDAELESIMAVLRFIAASKDLNNGNVDIGIVSFSTRATYHGRFQPLDPADPTKVNPTLESLLLGMRSGGYTHFDDALDKVIEYFDEAPADRTNLLFFLSDGIPNVAGDGDAEEPISTTYSNNHKSALMYDSEIELLDAHNVYRMSIGVGGGSDVREGFGLDLIDNTPDPVTGEKAIKVDTTDGLTKALLTNPLVGSVVDFKVDVNGVDQPSIDLTRIESGPTGFTFGTYVVNGLNPVKGYINHVTASISIDYDGNLDTVDDQHVLSTTNEVIGSLA